MQIWERNTLLLNQARVAYHELIDDSEHMKFTIEEHPMSFGLGLHAVRITSRGDKKSLYGWCTYANDTSAVFTLFNSEYGNCQNFNMVFQYVRDEQRWTHTLTRGQWFKVMDGTPREMSKPRNFFYGKFVRKMA